MKILKIRFKNINSFYGEHPAIDFTANPLASTGLFMISGPTGAGKSTLLDVISLALFNQIPRFSAKSLNSKQIAANGSVINLIAAEEVNAEAYAEVEYEVKETGYRSRWSISKNRNGNWREYDMEVCRLSNDEIISNKKSEAPVINEELIGLKYGQFIQSIVLSQGNFAEFLRAKEKERSKLLEDITGSHIYRKLGAAAFQKNKIAQEKIKLSEQSLEAITLLTDEERHEKQEILRESETKAKEINKKLSGFREQLNFKTQLDEATNGIADTNAKLVHWQSSFDAFAPNLQKLEMHAAVADLTKPITDLEYLRKSLAENINSVADNDAEIKEAADKNDKLLVDASALFTEKFTVENLEENVLGVREKVTDLQRKMDSLMNEGTATSDAIKKEILSSKDAFIKSLNAANYEENITTITTYETKLKEAYTEISDEEAEQLDLLNAQFETVSNWLTKQQEVEQITFDGKNEKKKETEKQQEITNLQALLPPAKDVVDKLNNELSNLEKQQEAERKKVNLEKLRTELTENEPCPLCGSTEHPYRQHITHILGTLDLQIQEKKTEIRTSEKSYNDQLANEKVLQTELAAITKALEKYRQKLTDAKKKCQEYASAMGVEPNKSIAELEESKAEIQQKRTVINEYNRQKETLNTIRQLKDWSRANFERINNYVGLDKEKKKLYVGKNIQQDCERLLTDFRKNQNLIEGLIKQNNELKKQIIEKQKQEESDNKLLSKLLLEKSISSLEEAKKQLLTTTEMKVLLDKKEALQNHEIKLKTELAGFLKQEKHFSEKITLKESVEDLKSRVQLLTETYENLLRGIGTAKNMLANDTSNRDKLKDKLAEIDELRKNARKWDLLNTYIGDATGDKYSNFAQSLTLNNLIGLANQRLKHLSDRYVLSKLDQDFDSLRVIDLYQGNAERSVDTLSGGETFTLSLAMALALSDMASQNVKLDSLFIDEGFGTLDSETLEAAIATLERLQHDSQKTIGIISHRQELMSRVATQLIVSKGNDGKSSVSVTGF